MKYEVTLHGGSTGIFQFGWSARVDADSRADAIEQARTKARTDGFGSYGRPTVVELHTYAVTLRGRKDKRCRETYYADAPDAKLALSAVRHREQVLRFAGYVRSLDDPQVVKVERTSR